MPLLKKTLIFRCRFIKTRKNIELYIQLLKIRIFLRSKIRLRGSFSKGIIILANNFERARIIFGAQHTIMCSCFDRIIDIGKTVTASSNQEQFQVRKFLFFNATIIYFIYYFISLISNFHSFKNIIKAIFVNFTFFCSSSYFSKKSLNLYFA